MTGMRAWLLAGLCLTLAAGACNKRMEPVQPFPASQEVAGWTKTGNTRSFSAADLWKYIDGDAERYVKAGVELASTADYKFQDKFEVVVDVYTMGTAEGARAMLDAEPAGDAKTAQIGDCARVYGQSVIFRRGRYLVRTVAYEQSPELQGALLALARAVDRRLGKG